MTKTMFTQTLDTITFVENMHIGMGFYINDVIQSTEFLLGKKVYDWTEITAKQQEAVYEMLINNNAPRLNFLDCL